MKKLGLFLLLTLATQVLAATKITGVTIENNDSQSVMKVSLNGKFAGTPELNVEAGHVQIVLKDAYVWPKIEKKIGNTTVMAYQYDKNLTRVRAMIPQNLVGREKEVNLRINDNSIEVMFPNSAQVTTAEAPKAAATTNKEAYDETYLDQLANEKTNAQIANINIANKAPASTKMAPLSSGHSQKDEVKVAQAAPVSESTSAKPSFSFAGYVGKFVAFLGVVLLLFYGVVQLMKKGVLGKGKLGFLNNTQLVQVLSTTHIAPKRSLILVKAHQQVLLLSQSEAGVQFISEIHDTTGILKQGEKEVAGSNFDTNLEKAESLADLDRKIKLKRNNVDEEVNDLDTLLNSAPQEDKVSFSDQLKKKVKGLKPLSQ